MNIKEKDIDLGLPAMNKVTYTIFACRTLQL